MVSRRRLLIALGANLLSAPLASFAQPQGKVWRVGFMASRHLDFVDSDYNYGPFRQGMRELGYVEGKNLVIEWRSAEGKYERLPGLAAELVNLKVDIIVTTNTPATSAAQKATATIPIVMGSIADPVANGFVKSLRQPAGNITGLANMSEDVSPKQLEMLLAMVPKLSRVALLVNPSNPANVKSVDIVQSAGHKLGVKILRADARTPQEIDDAFLDTPAERRCADDVDGAVFPATKKPDCGIGRETSATSDGRGSDLFRGWRSDELRPEHCRPVPALGNVCGQDSQGR